MATLADLLTVSRVPIAFALAVALARDRFDLAIVLLSVSWVTDFLDGRVARSAVTATRLPTWDLPMDTLVGAGALIGLQAGDHVPAWLGAGALIVFGGLYLLFRNPAMGMLTQAVGYGAVLYLAWTSGVPYRWAPLLVIGVLLAVDFERFTKVILPLFFAGFRPGARESRADNDRPLTPP